MHAPAKPEFRIGPFRLDPTEQALFRDDKQVPLTPKAFELLAFLVENRGRLVTKEELLAAIWPATFVEEAVLAVNIHAVRKALGDDRNGHSFIETVPRRGYRFIAPVTEEGWEVAEPASSPVAASRVRGRRVAVALALAGVVVAVLLYRHLSEKPGAVGGRAMLAVLPFENFSKDAADEYLSDGLTEEMITQLASLNPESLGVIARTSAMQYKHRQKGTAQIGHELGVDYILEGSVRQAGERVRISAQLVRVRDQTHLWAQNYDRDIRDILALHNEIAAAIAREISVKLTSPSRRRVAGTRPVNPVAYEAYLKGRYFWNKRTQDGFEKALAYFQQSLEQDPNYALAYSGLADTYILLGYYSILPPNKAYPAAKEAALKALEIDPALAEAHSSLAGVFMDYEWAWDTVENEYRRALQLNPGYAVAHQWYGNYLSAMGRSGEAIQQTLRARELDPLSMIVNTNVGWAYHLARHYDLAIAEGKKALEFDPNFYWAHLLLGRAYEAKQMYGEAIAYFLTASTLSGGNSMVLAELAHAYAVAGRPTEAEEILQRLSQKQYVPPFEIALIHIGLGRKDQAFVWLEKSFQDRARSLGFAKVEPRLDPLRSDPRFQDLLKRMKLLSPRPSGDQR